METATIFTTVFQRNPGAHCSRQRQPMTPEASRPPQRREVDESFVSATSVRRPLKELINRPFGETSGSDGPPLFITAHEVTFLGAAGKSAAQLICSKPTGQVLIDFGSFQARPPRGTHILPPVRRGPLDAVLVPRATSTHACQCWPATDQALSMLAAWHEDDPARLSAEPVGRGAVG